jgi:ribosomal protein L35
MRSNMEAIKTIVENNNMSAELKVEVIKLLVKDEDKESKDSVKTNTAENTEPYRPRRISKLGTFEEVVGRLRSGMSPKEIADEAGVKVGNVYNMFTRRKTSLTKVLTGKTPKRRRRKRTHKIVDQADVNYIKEMLDKYGKKPSADVRRQIARTLGRTVSSVNGIIYRCRNGVY